MTLSNFVINNLYPNNSEFINFPAGYDSNLSYIIISSNTYIATITNDNVINALSDGTTTITFSQGGDTITTTLTVDAVPVLIQANNQSITYGGTIPSLTYNINHQITDIKKSSNKQNIGIIIARQKVGYGINLNNGLKISDLIGINLSRFDSGNSTNPYINIWVTNSDYTNYAVISISPTWSKEYSNASYDILKNEDIFIYETVGVQLEATGNYPTLVLGYQGTSWISNVSGVSGPTVQLKLSDLANLEIKAPPTSWFDGTHGTGSGAPRELSNYSAYGFNWIFGNINNNGDGTLADYIIGNATCNQSSLFIPYIIRNSNDGIPPNIITDLVYSQSNISISTNPISTLANSSSIVGNYDITFDSSKFNSPYNLTFSNATLIITQAIIYVTSDSKIRVYRSSNPFFTYTYTGFLNSDTDSVITGTPSISTSAIESSPLGTYDIIPTISGLSSTNYTFSAINGTLTITKVIINVIADNKSKDYGTNNPSFTYIYTGFLSGDDSSVITGSPLISTSATQSSSVNGPNSDKTYNINVSNGNLSSTNYNFNPVSGKLTINPITPIVSWKQDYVPPMIYGCRLTHNQLSALSTDKISGISNGNFMYNVVSSNNIQTTVSLGSTIPTTGNYTLYATLSVTNPNYLSSPVVTVSKRLNIVTSNLSVKWYNPVPISYDNPLTNAQLNAVCNDPNAIITYVPPLGSTLSNGNQNLSVTFNTTDPGFTYDEIKNKVNINIT